MVKHNTGKVKIKLSIINIITAEIPRKEYILNCSNNSFN